VTGESSPLQEDNRQIAFYGFRGGPGGLSHVMLNLMNAVSVLGWKVDILLHRTDIPELASLHPAIRRVELGKRGGLGRVASLVGYLRATRPVALVVNREPAARTATVARLLHGSSTKLVIRVGMAISSALERRGPLKRCLRRLGMVFCYRRADVIIANAQRVADDIAEVIGLPREAIAILDNPTVTPELLELSSLPAGHPWLDQPGPPVILGVGRLVRQKDFHSLIGAFAKVRCQRDCRLILLGEGKDRKKLEAFAEQLGIAEDVAMPGFVANPFAYMKRASVFVLSSAWEGSPNVLIQAMAIGTPCVSTDCPGGSHEILGAGRFGPLVPIGDEAALAEGIVQCLVMPQPSETLREAVRRFQADSCAKAYLRAMGIDHHHK
jgi:glycosyltransferase involved in cell wall biosynthesis